MRQASEVRALQERIGYLEAEIERMREVEHELRGQMTNRLPMKDFHEMLDRRGVPREANGRRLVLNERLDWLGGKREV